MIAKFSAISRSDPGRPYVLQYSGTIYSVRKCVDNLFDVVVNGIVDCSWTIKCQAEREVELHGRGGTPYAYFDIMTQPCLTPTTR